MVGAGQALWQRPDGGDTVVGESEGCRDDGGADHRDEDRGQSGRHPREHEQHGEDADAHEQRRRVGLVEVLDELLDLVQEAVGARSRSRTASAAGRR